MHKNNPVIAIVGPTGIGKTDFALELAEEWPIEIINLDSVLVYRALNIGSAKPSVAEMQAVPHHLIDIVDLNQGYSVAQYIHDVVPVIDAVRKKGKIPVLVGGSMMYLWCLENGLKSQPKTTQEVRRDVQLQALSLGWAAMHARLRELNPAKAMLINEGDKQRISRAIELEILDYNAVLEEGFAGIELDKIILLPHDRQKLYDRLNNRFLYMLDNGLVDELQGLNAIYGRPLGHADPRNSVGYKQVGMYLDGALSWDEMCDKGQQASRNLAKKQLTWLKKMDGLELVRVQTSDWLNIVKHKFL